MVGGAGGRQKKVEGKGDLKELGDASDSVLLEYESQNGVEIFEVLEGNFVWIQPLTTLPKMSITKELCTHLSVSSKATGSRDQ